MKTEMKMLENGNYESVVCPIQHYCNGPVVMLDASNLLAMDLNCYL